MTKHEKDKYNWWLSMPKELRQEHINEIKHLSSRLHGWNDGYKYGAKLDEEPHILLSALINLYDYAKLLEELFTQDDSEESNA